jgi:hypothetical protein
MLVSPWTTCLFVSTSPSDVSTIPVPAARSVPFRTTSMSTTPVSCAAVARYVACEPPTPKRLRSDGKPDADDAEPDAPVSDHLGVASTGAVAADACTTAPAPTATPVATRAAAAIVDRVRRLRGTPAGGPPAHCTLVGVSFSSLSIDRLASWLPCPTDPTIGRRGHGKHLETG